MQKQLIYDLPTRIFHWAFAALFVFAFFIAKTVDDDSPTFSYHMLAGLMLGGLIILRLIWGWVGTKYARFSSFALHPKDLSEYFKGILSGDKKRWAGHNPASSWAALIMMGSTMMLAITGVLMTSGAKETFEDVHELFSTVLLVTVLLHIAGVLLHALRHQDGISLSMIHGKKEVSEGHSEISGHKPVVALLFVVVIGTFGGYLVNNYNNSTRELNFFGRTLSLAEDEKENEKHEKKIENNSHDEESEEDDD
jgi:cytochrome b